VEGHPFPLSLGVTVHSHVAVRFEPARFINQLLFPQTLDCRTFVAGSLASFPSLLSSRDDFSDEFFRSALRCRCRRRCFRDGYNTDILSSESRPFLLCRESLFLSPLCCFISLFPAPQRLQSLPSLSFFRCGFISVFFRRATLLFFFVRSSSFPDAVTFPFFAFFPSTCATPSCSNLFSWPVHHREGKAFLPTGSFLP